MSCHIYLPHITTSNLQFIYHILYKVHLYAFEKICKIGMHHQQYLAIQIIHFDISISTDL